MQNRSALAIVQIKTWHQICKRFVSYLKLPFHVFLNLFTRTSQHNKAKKRPKISEDAMFKRYLLKPYEDKAPKVANTYRPK